MSLFKVFDVSGTALTAQSQRLNTIASNLANAESVTSASGETYRAKHVIFSPSPRRTGRGRRESHRRRGGHVPLRRVHDPAHPLADDKGYVNLPNVNVVDEMVNMISASRSYQTNVELMNTAKTLLLKTLPDRPVRIRINGSASHSGDWSGPLRDQRLKNLTDSSGKTSLDGVERDDPIGDEQYGVEIGDDERDGDPGPVPEASRGTDDESGSAESPRQRAGHDTACADQHGERGWTS